MKMKLNIKSKMRRWFFNRLLEDFDSLCGTLSSTYNHPDEAYRIRCIIEKLGRKENENH